MQCKIYLHIFPRFAKGLSNDDDWVAKGTVFQELRMGAGFKTGEFVKEKLGGAIVERLPREIILPRNSKAVSELVR